MWSVRDARNRFSALVEAAQRGEPQVVTKRGAPAVVVIAVEQYARLKALEKQPTPSFANHLLAVPQDDKAFDRLDIEPRP
jgi:antitoxin Phd